jgi:hypothetical protein
MRIGSMPWEKFLDKDNVQGLLPQFVKDASDIKHKLGLFENLKIAYAQLVAQKSKENLSYRNTLLTIVVSNEVGPSQRYISKTIGGSRYLLSKAVTHRIHVGFIGDNIWGGLPQKWCSNIVGEIDHELSWIFATHPQQFHQIAKIWSGDI